MLRLRCLQPSPRSAPSSKLSPLYVPVSPVSRAERCKPCLMALVPTLGCSRPLPPTASSCWHPLCPEIKYRDMSFCSSKNGPYIRTRLVTPQEKNKHTGSITPTDAFAPASTSGRPRGGRAQAALHCLHPFPRTHVEIWGRNGLVRRAPKPHTNPIYMCTAATTAACCCYC